MLESTEIVEPTVVKIQAIKSSTEAILRTWATESAFLNRNQLKFLILYKI